VVQLPGYAPDPNAVEGRLAGHESGRGNHTRTLDELKAVVHGRLRQIQRQPDLINALLSQTGLALDPPPWTMCFQPL
jgi:hypothetical protein